MTLIEILKYLLETKKNCHELSITNSFFEIECVEKIPQLHAEYMRIIVEVEKMEPIGVYGDRRLNEVYKIAFNDSKKLILRLLRGEL